MEMEALAILHHHRHQPLCSSSLHYCPSLRSSMSSLFLSPPSTSLSSPSIRASSSSSPLPSSSDPSMQNLQNPEAKSSLIPNPFHKVASFATLTTASAILFLGFCRNALIHSPIMLPPTGSPQESMDEKIHVEEFMGTKPDHVQSILYLKLKEKVPIVHSFIRTKDDDQAWQVLKAQVFSCGEELELVKIGFEGILEKDSCGNKAYHDRILEYLEMVDECKGLLKDIKVAMDRCEKENGDIKYYLRFFNKVIARIKVLEGDMVGALKYFQELEQQ